MNEPWGRICLDAVQPCNQRTFFKKKNFQNKRTLRQNMPEPRGTQSKQWSSFFKKRTTFKTRQNMQFKKKKTFQNQRTLTPFAVMPQRNDETNSGVTSALHDSWRHLPHRVQRNQYGSIWSMRNVRMFASVLPWVAQTRFHFENGT